MKQSTWLRMGLAFAAAMGASAAAAHDFFLLPDSFSSAQTGEIGVKATVSASFPRLEAVVPQDRIGNLHAAGPGEPRLRVAGPATNALGLGLTVSRPGLAVLGVSALPRDVEYGEDRIGIILEEYRIDPSSVAGLDRLPQPRTLRVSSRRFAKTLVCVASCADRSAAAQPLGADLEFVGAGQGTDHFVLLSRGRPLANHNVDFVGADGNRRHLHTDGQGQVHLPADARGTLMLFAALMEPPQQGDRFTLNLSSLTLAR